MFYLEMSCKLGVSCLLVGCSSGLILEPSSIWSLVAIWRFLFAQQRLASSRNCALEWGVSYLFMSLKRSEPDPWLLAILAFHAIMIVPIYDTTRILLNDNHFGTAPCSCFSVSRQVRPWLLLICSTQRFSVIMGICRDGVSLYGSLQTQGGTESYVDILNFLVALSNPIRIVILAILVRFVFSNHGLEHHHRL